MDNITMLKQGAKDGLPIFLGYVAVSFTFGIAALKVLEPFQAVLMSASNYTSAGQFAALGLIAASAGFGEMAAAQMVVNLRYSLMSCCISQKLDSDSPVYHRFFIAMGITDEVFGVTTAVQGSLSPAYAYGVMSVALPGWIFGTFLGVMSTGFMPPNVMSALGIAIYGMFIAIIFPPIRDDHRLALIVTASMACSVCFDNVALLAQITPAMKLIALTLIIAGAAAVLFPLEKREAKPAVGYAAECKEGAR